MFRLHLESAIIKVSVAIGKDAVTDWDKIRADKEREKQAARDRRENIEQREKAFQARLPTVMRNMFDAVVKEINDKHDATRSYPGQRTSVRFERGDDFLRCTRTDPYEAMLLLAVVGWPDDDTASATLEASGNGFTSSGVPSGFRLLYKVYCNSDGAFFFENRETSNPTPLKEDQVRSEFMKKFVYYIVD